MGGEVGRVLILFPLTLNYAERKKKEKKECLTCFVGSSHNVLLWQYISFQGMLMFLIVCVFAQGKETTEEEDEVAVGMEKGFMDEFFEQVCVPHSHHCYSQISH